jgi:hypothetical protein
MAWEMPSPLAPIPMQADEDADFILIDVPSCKGWGYSEKTLQGKQK